MRLAGTLSLLLCVALTFGACSDEGAGAGRAGGAADGGAALDVAPRVDSRPADDLALKPDEGGPGEDGGASEDSGREEDSGPGADRGRGEDRGAGADRGPGEDLGPGEAVGAADGGADPGPLPGFGALSGECGLIDGEELRSPQPFWFVNAIDFGVDPYDEADLELLSPGGQRIIEDGNAGGSSLLSEVFAYEVLHRCDRAVLLETENNIDYVREGSITDLLVEIDGERVGVSVTRAVGWPRDDPYTVADATRILEHKLEGVLESSANVVPEHAWVKQILAVIAYAPGHVEPLRAAWDGLDPALKADTIIVVSVSDGDDAFLY